MTGDRLANALEQMAALLVAEMPLGETSWRVAVTVRDVWPAVDAVGVTLLDDRGRPTVPVSTDEVAAAVDVVQHDAGTGPCLDAARSATLLPVDDTRAVPGRWRAFGEVAARVGVLSALAVPLTTHRGTLGALGLYAGAPGAFDPPTCEEARRLAGTAAVVLANARAYWATSEHASGLEQAMASRAVIEQAKGKIMAIRGCGPTEAFAILARASQRENVKVRDLAQRMIECHVERPVEVTSDDGA